MGGNQLSIFVKRHDLGRLCAPEILIIISLDNGLVRYRQQATDDVDDAFSISRPHRTSCSAKSTESQILDSHGIFSMVLLTKLPTIISCEHETSCGGNAFSFTGPLCEWNPPVTGGFYSHRANNGLILFYILPWISCLKTVRLSLIWLETPCRSCDVIAIRN